MSQQKEYYNTMPILSLSYSINQTYQILLISLLLLFLVFFLLNFSIKTIYLYKFRLKNLFYWAFLNKNLMHFRSLTLRLLSHNAFLIIGDEIKKVFYRKKNYQ